MAATLTKVKGPYKQAGRGVGYTFSVLLDTSFASNGEPIDLTPYLSYLYEGSCKGVDAVADAAYLYTVVGPGRAVAVTNSNVVIEVHRTPAIPAASQAAQAFAEATSVDLSSVGALIVEVWGKDAKVTSWA